jgi:methylase of polypeptide subunit release factors
VSTRELAVRLREIGVTAELLRTMPARHAAIRDDAAALAVRRFRDGAVLTAEEESTLFGDCAPAPPGLALDVIDGLYVFSAPDEVLGPGESTAILYRAARQIAGDRLLDLGCGCGTLSLLLWRARTVGSDINVRALELAHWNASVNGIAGCEFRLGSLYAPVAGEQFDLIVSQPPYVPLPAGETPHPYYHASARGDELARAVLQDAAEHLAPAGRALVFSDWALAEGESLRDRIPHAHARITVWASRAIQPASYFAPQPADVVAVHNCLVMVEAGSGYREYEVLPHEWGSIGIQ